MCIQCHTFNVSFSYVCVMHLVDERSRHTHYKRGVFRRCEADGGVLNLVYSGKLAHISHTGTLATASHLQRANNNVTTKKIVCLFFLFEITYL